MRVSNAIEVRDLSKTFRIPTNQVTTLRERFAQRTKSTYREVPVLDGISFDVRRGEFLGIAGRNGSGKSTLLKILAGIYRPDSGTAFGAGRVAPIIELGVGFSDELPAYDNVMMNAVMMGLQPAEARRRYREIIEFAELSDFEHLKLAQLLLRHARPAWLRGDDPRGRGHPALRRGARGRRRPVQGEVLGDLQAPAE